MRRTTFLALLSSLYLTSAQQQASICEDTIDSQPPFNNNNIPCLLGCGLGVTRPTGDLLPGQVNTTETPYCRLNRVRPEGATPAQSSAAPACNSQCENGNSATPDQLGWCMYWCVQGGEIEEMVVSTTCIPSIQYTPVATETRDGITLTVQEFTMPTQWYNWYQTQTVLTPRSSQLAFAPSTATPTSAGTDDESTLAGLCGTSEYEVRCSTSDTMSTMSMTSMVSMTTSKASSSGTTIAAPSTTTAADAQSQSAETRSGSTPSTVSGASDVCRPHWMLQALVAWIVAFV